MEADDYVAVFDRFRFQPGRNEVEWAINHVGARQRRVYDASVTPAPDASRPAETVVGRPPLNEEFFEWADLLHAVDEARGRLVMIELGAGYGRWSVNCALAARQRPDLDVRLVAVEAEPQHFLWLEQHFRDNGLDPADHRLIQAAVTVRPGSKVPFFVGNAAAWYGQELVPLDQRGFVRRVKDRIKRRRLYANRELSHVRAVSLPSILDPLDHVDLIDMDIQGEEARVVPAAIDELTAKVRRMHIETHHPDGEAILRETLTAHGWTAINDYPVEQECETPYGPVYFQGGVQSWVNERVAPTPRDSVAG